MVELTLYDYQERAVLEIIQNDSRLFEIGTGLGKTVIILAAAKYYKECIGLRRQLILTRAVLVESAFDSEIKRFEIFKPHEVILNMFPTHNPEGVYIASYEMFRLHWSRIKDWHWDAVYLDESHAIANRNASITRIINGDWRGIGALRRDRTYLFSGTLVPNRPEQIFPQLKAVGYPGTWTQFKTKYFINPIPNLPFVIKLNPLKKQEFYEDVGKWIYSITHNDVSEVVKLPEKQYITHSFKLEDELRRKHDTVRKHGIYEGEVLNNVLVRVLRCRQITSESEQRLLILERLAASLSRHRHKILFYSFNSDLNKIKNVIYNEEKYEINGSISASTKTRRIRKWKETGGWLLCQFNCGKNGLTLIESKVIIYYNLEDNNESYQQSQDRIRRIGQKEDTVEYHVIVAQNTVDEVILDSLKRKANIQEELRRYMQ